jgi:hypothetical protein
MQAYLDQNPKLKLLSKGKLVKALDGRFSKAEIHAHYNPREIAQIYAARPAVKPLKITAPPFSFQIDVARLPAYKTSNGGKTDMLLCVDILSRKAFAYPLKSGKMSEILVAFEKFNNDVVDAGGGPVNSVAGDAFFDNAQFKKVCDSKMINLYTDVAADDHLTGRIGNKLGIVDRFTRTIKLYIQKYMLVHRDLAWTKFLPELISLYNETAHAGLKDATPDEVFDDTDYTTAQHKGDVAKNQAANESFHLPPGTTVRIMMGKELYGKEKARFSTELYTVLRQVGYRFELADESGKPVRRKYRPAELLKVTAVTERMKDVPRVAREVHKKAVKVKRALKVVAVEPAPAPPPKKSVRKAEQVDGETHYEIEKLVEKKVEDRKTYYLVKWAGYSKAHNQWISATQLQQDLSADAFRRMKSAVGK